eukprot:1633274-Rhodomonas_salina.2
MAAVHWSMMHWGSLHLEKRGYYSWMPEQLGEWHRQKAGSGYAVDDPYVKGGRGGHGTAMVCISQA